MRPREDLLQRGLDDWSVCRFHLVDEIIDLGGYLVLFSHLPNLLLQTFRERAVYVEAPSSVMGT
jgi:hypothetical protein